VKALKRLISFVLLAVLALSLSACAGTGKQGTTRVKCPACGYEFDTPKE
jgi:Flp pilus assembly protein TadD